MFSEQSLCNCRTCGKRLTYDTLGAIFHYKWDDVGWAYCKDHIPSASINIDHVDLVGMSYNDSTPSMTVDVDAYMTDGSSLPFRAIWTDIPGIKAVLEQVQGTVGEIDSLVGHDWIYDAATGEIQVTADADIRNFTPSPIANTKLTKILKDNTLPTAIRNTVQGVNTVFTMTGYTADTGIVAFTTDTVLDNGNHYSKPGTLDINPALQMVKVAAINGNGTPTIDMDAGTIKLKVSADTDHPGAGTSKSRTFDLNIVPALQQVKVATLVKDGTETFDPTTKHLTVPVKADTDHAATGTSKQENLDLDISAYIPEPGDPAKVAYIQKNGTESFNPTTNELSVPLKADTDQAASGTSLTITLPIDLTQIITDAMKKVKVISITQNGTPSFDGTAKTLSVPVKADTDHPDTGSAKTETLAVDATPVLNAVKVDTISGNGTPTYDAATQKMTVPLKADTNFPSSTSQKTDSIAVDISTPIADEQKKVKVDSISGNGTPTYDAATKTVTVPLKADTDHPSTGTAKTDSIDVDISQWAGGEAKVDYIQKNGDPTYNDTTKILTQSMKADVTEPSSGSSKIASIEIDLAPYIKDRKVDPATIVPNWISSYTTYDAIDGVYYVKLANPSGNPNFIAKKANKEAWFVSKIVKLTIKADTTDPTSTTKDQAEVPINVEVQTAPKVTGFKGYGYGTQPSDTIHYDAMQRPQTNNYPVDPPDVNKTFSTLYERKVYNMARAGMCFKTDVEADLNYAWTYDLGSYGDVSTGLRSVSNRSSWSCNIRQAGHIGPGTERPTVNVVDNNWWDGIWSCMSRSLGIAILLPDDPNNPHGALINGEVYDEWKAQYRKGFQISLVAGNFFDPAVDVPAKFYAGEWEDLGNNAKCNILLSNFVDPGDKTTIQYPWSEAFIQLPGENEWICPFLDTSMVWLDRGMYHYRTNGDQQNRSGNHVYAADPSIVNVQLILQTDTDLRVEGTSIASKTFLPTGDTPGEYISCYRFKLCGRRPRADGTLTDRYIMAFDTLLSPVPWNSYNRPDFDPKKPPSWPAEWLQKVISY